MKPSVLEMISSKVLFFVFAFLKLYGVSGNVIVGPCDPTIIITSSLNSCYNNKASITLTWTTICVPLNVFFEIKSCVANSRVCRTLKIVPGNQFSLQVDIDGSYTPGVLYYLQVCTEDGCAEAKTTPFTVGEPRIEVTSATNKCYPYKGILTVEYEATCFPSRTLIPLITCTEIKGQKVCTKVGAVSSDDCSASISLTDPFACLNYYTILFAYETGYETITAVTGTFVVKEKCPLEPEITILSTVDVCYNPKDIVVVDFLTSGIPLNCDLGVDVCSKQVCSFVQTVAVSAKTVSVEICIPPFIEGTDQCIHLSYGGRSFRTGTFLVGYPSLQITSTLQDTYRKSDIIQICYTCECLDSGAILDISVCCSETSNCLVISDIINGNPSCFYIALKKEPFKVGDHYYFKIQGQAEKDQSAIGVTRSFVVTA